MQEWLDGMAGPGYAAAILWTLAALVLLLVVLLIVKLVRSLTFGTFVAGGRNRKTRLAVMDATAVDSHRRLVLVRRDDIEHLLLIGGPTDVVVERDIRLVPARRQPPPAEHGNPHPAAPPRPRAPQPAPAPVHRQVPAGQQYAAAPPPPPPAPQRGPAAAVAPPPAPRPEPVPHPKDAANPEPPARPVSAPASPAEIDDTLLRELEVSLEETPDTAPVSAPKAPPSLDDEMARLLGELSHHRK
ncbi:hypothetical protein ACTDI4_11595 [Mesorhizobium sp. PUT5]|uniref:hypothetical protein n=1 Tax=Mesorhizobium sp. PUT5 TaxID=3454629 RepID=UPI003FA4A3DE